MSSLGRRQLCGNGEILGVGAASMLGLIKARLLDVDRHAEDARVLEEDEERDGRGEGPDDDHDATGNLGGEEHATASVEDAVLFGAGVVGRIRVVLRGEEADEDEA